jgi:hypothetical protein
VQCLTKFGENDIQWVEVDSCGMAEDCSSPTEPKADAEALEDLGLTVPSAKDPDLKAYIAEVNAAAAANHEEALRDALETVDGMSQVPLVTKAVVNDLRDGEPVKKLLGAGPLARDLVKNPMPHDKKARPDIVMKKCVWGCETVTPHSWDEAMLDTNRAPVRGWDCDVCSGARVEAWKAEHEANHAAARLKSRCGACDRLASVCTKEPCEVEQAYQDDLGDDEGAPITPLSNGRKFVHDTDANATNLQGWPAPGEIVKTQDEDTGLADYVGDANLSAEDMEIRDDLLDADHMGG